MKIGTDGVLLGAWLSCEGCRQLLDIGTGSGLIALMAAQKCAAGGDRAFYITAIDIDPAAAGQAAENFAASPWVEHLEALPQSLQEYAAGGHSGQFDLMVSNPPYYVAGKCIIPSGEKRTAARDDAELSFDDILQAASDMLSPRGRLCLIMPCAREEEFTMKAAGRGFGILRRCLVSTTARKAPSRLLVEAGKAAAGIPETSTLTLGSEAWKALTGEFYLY